MLKGKNIDFSYSKDKTFIKNLNIDIPKGKVTTILGPNEVVSQHYLVFYLVLISHKKVIYI